MITPIEEYMPHLVAEVMCAKCLRRWIAVFPERTPLINLECPGCNLTGFVFCTGQIIKDPEEE